MSYDLRIAGDGLDLAGVRAALAEEGLEPEGDEVVWARDALVATILLSPGSVDVGVVGADATPEERAREFGELVGFLLDVAERAGGRLEDEQLGRPLDRASAAEAVRGFA